MKFPAVSSSLVAAFLLLGAGAVFISVALLTDRGGITSAAVVISGAICFFTGIFILTFAGGKRLIQRSSPFFRCRAVSTCAGSQPISASTVPHRTLPETYHKQTGVWQLIPVSRYDGKTVTGDSFLITGCGGVLVPPSCTPVLSDLCTPAQPCGPCRTRRP